MMNLTESFEKNLTLERAKEIIDVLVGYVQASCTDSHEMAETLVGTYGFTSDELKELDYDDEAVCNAY